MENQENKSEEVPEVVINEANDKPAGKNIIKVIFFVIIILVIVYFIFFRNDPVDPI